MTGRGEDTRKQLLDAAATVFSRCGYARATTREIAKEARVSEGTIYRHFADKKTLFQAVFAEFDAATATAITGLSAMAGTNTVRENVLFLVRAIEEIEADLAPLRAAMSSDSDLAAVLLAPDGDAEGSAGAGIGPVAPLARYLEAEQRLGRVRADVDVRHAAFALFAIPFAAVVTGRVTSAAGAAGEVDMVGAIGVVLHGIEADT